MAASSAAVTVTKVWPLEKYARFVPDAEPTELLLPGAQQKDMAIKASGGNWKHYQSGGDRRIQLTLLEANHLMISNGTQIYESFSLWNSQKWIKGVTKGDSVLFIYKLNDQNHRFRIKFAQTSLSSSLEACKNCISSLAPLLPIRELETCSTNSITDSQHLPSSYEDSQLLPQQTFPTQQTAQDLQREVVQQSQTLSESHKQVSNCHAQATVGRGGYHSSGDYVSGKASKDQPDDNLLSVADLAKTLYEGKSLGLAYASTNFPTEQLGAFIRLCLTDSNFPAFVEAVEKEMNSINK